MLTEESPPVAPATPEPPITVMIGGERFKVVLIRSSAEGPSYSIDYTGRTIMVARVHNAADIVRTVVDACEAARQRVEEASAATEAFERVLQ